MAKALAQPSVIAVVGLRRRLRRAVRGSAIALRGNPNMLLGFVVIVVMMGLALAAPWITFYDPIRLDPSQRLLSPSEQHWFGTDQIGRDVYTRTVYGTRVSLIVGFTVAAVTSIIGVVIGLLSGYFRPLDGVLMRIMDAMMAFPSFLLAIALVAAMSASLWTVIIALAIVFVGRTARLARASVLTLREVDFVDAARAVGARPLRIMFIHILPNSMAPILVQGTFIFAVAILLEASLSFLGTGVPPEVPTWGNTMGQGRQVAQIAVWVIFFPGLFLSFTVLGVNLVGDGLRDALDPKLRGKVQSTS